jgi:hypothetical protein
MTAEARRVCQEEDAGVEDGRAMNIEIRCPRHPR